ncbi:MAG: SdpI family protein [Candidatus Doudnabacteria bacterium]|nr:SdpI family protein [Candidatus Doudnabacteria bacterium]
MKYELKKELFSLLILGLAWAAGWYFYQHFPATVVTHWNFNGTPDAWGSKSTNAWGIPGLLTGMYLLFTFLPQIDPRKDRYPEFLGVYRKFKNLILLVLFVVMLAAGFYNLGYNIKIQYVVPTLVGLLLIVIGNYMGKIKPNWFMGIRTPWTMSSENVWNKTHRVGGYAFIFYGLMIILSPFLPKVFGLSILLLGVAIMVIGTFGYSYWAYRKEQVS